ncbi:MAG: YraN family protein [Candidatus Acidiferrales bacterium]
MSVFARLVFAWVDFGARKGLTENVAEDSSGTPLASAKKRARQTGIRGETYAYWYLRRHGYILVARNYMFPGFKGEIDIVGYDGPVLAFVEVKTRVAPASGQSSLGYTKPEEAVHWDKQRNLTRMAQQFLRVRRIESSSYRFDILAIESRAGAPPEVRLHKGAFRPYAWHAE